MELTPVKTTRPTHRRMLWAPKKIEFVPPPFLKASVATQTEEVTAEPSPEKPKRTSPPQSPESIATLDSIIKRIEEL